MPQVSRRTCLIIAAISGAAFIFSLVPLTQRIAEFNQHAHLARFHAEPSVARQFKLAAFPEVKLTDAVTEDGRSALRLDYAGKTYTLLVQPPPVRDLPALVAYDEWFKVLAINQVITGPDGRSAPAPGSERLLLVSRRTPEGFSPDSWGTVRRAEWLFDIHDLKPSGEVVSITYRWPRSEQSERGLAKRNQSPDAKPWEIELQKLPRLDERSIEYFAAMHVIPKLNVPSHKFSDTALSPRVLGWTLPVSMLSFLVLTGALAFAIGPWSGPATPGHRKQT